MQILLLGLFVALFLHDTTTAVETTSAGGTLRTSEALPADAWPGLGPLPVLAIVLGPKLLLLIIYQTMCMRTRRKLGQTGGQRALNTLERLTAALPLLLLVLFICDLAFGGLRVVRLALQHVVLIDELIVMLPTLLVATAAWWSYYPVDRRLRESLIFRNADTGRPIVPLLSRGQYVSMQMRHQFGLLLLPLLVVFAWYEALTLLGPDHRGVLSPDLALTLTPVGVIAVLILSPLVIRYVWHTAPLGTGEVRDRMLALCKMHRVRVRELLLWRTGGGMVNAAVTGLIRQVRFILLSDGLLDQVSARGIEAVMAHEIAHVRLRHMFWMIAVLLATLGGTELAANLAFDQFVPAPVETADADAVGGPPMIDLHDPNVRLLITAVPAFLVTMLVFGWVSRRIERQADVFAARHLVLVNEQEVDSRDATRRRVLAEALSDGENQPGPQLTHPPDPATRSIAAVQQVETPCFTEDAVNTMIHALQRVAELNHAPIHRKSWRHGSIAWRQDHLRSLVGQPVDDTPVDRVLGWVKIVTLVVVAGLILTHAAG